MSQSFDQPTWKARVAAWWREHAPDWRQAMQRLGVETAYGMLTASAFLPLLEAYYQSPGLAMKVLVELVGGVGGNLVANVMQGAYDKARALHVEQEIAENPELRAGYEALLNKLEVLNVAQTALGDQWAAFETKLREELARMGGGLHVEAGGGVVLGDVKVSYGDFVGRDQYNIHNEISIGVPDTPPTDLLRAYYRSLADECRHLPLGIVDPKFTQPAGEGEVALHEVYVNLDVVAPVRDETEDAKAWGLRLARGEGRGRTPLLEALADAKAARVVLLGDPGSGKTTFVNYLTYRMAAAIADDGGADARGNDVPSPLQGLLPVRLILREVATYLPPEGCGTAQMLWDAVRADVTRRLGEPAAERLMPYMQEQRLLREGGLFLLDGLDEVPEAGRRRQCLLEAVQQLIACLPPEGRVLLTARPYAYADPVWQIPGLPILALAPFNEAQVRHFVDHWYAAVHPVMGWSPQEAAARGERLAEALEARPRLGDLASRPLLLTLMATLHTSWGQLPEDRANLYEESVRLLLARWQRAREVRALDGERERRPALTAALGVSEAVLRAALEQLAYTAHARQGQAAQRDDAQADIPAGEVLTVLAPRVPDDVNPRRALTYLETRAGLLLGRRPGVYAFLHRSFQEYLAACYLANTAQDFGGRLRALVWDDVDWWREVFLLGVGKKRQGGLGDAVNVVTALVPEGPGEVPDITETHWHAAALAGTALLDLDLGTQRDMQPHHRALLRRVRRWLAQLVAEGHLPPRERLEAGDVLGRLGDPRPGVGVCSLPPRVGEGSGPVLSAAEGPVLSAAEGTREIPDILWVPIPDGPFLMGSPDDDPDAYADEKPQHELTLPDYYIARYPITNAQFRPFMEGDGYTNSAYWTEQGWAWRQGAEADLSIFNGVQDEERWKQQYREWLARRPVDKRDRPFFWEDSRRGAPTRPVVGITWFEAVAYTRWLEAQFNVAGATLRVWQAGKVEEINVQLGTLKVQLPSEAEWEKAARGPVLSVAEGPGLSAVEGPGRKYPWGHAWRENCGNIESTDLKQTNPVGIFPDGASPYGVMEMVGNVWEWTRSRWGERSVTQADYGYPYDPDDGRERLGGMKIPILRGGSYYHDESAARCACRYRGGPNYFNDDDGFRAVVSLVCSDC